VTLKLDRDRGEERVNGVGRHGPSGVRPKPKADSLAVATG
jgi:hypothetical protein